MMCLGPASVSNGSPHGVILSELAEKGDAVRNVGVPAGRTCVRNFWGGIAPFTIWAESRNTTRASESFEFPAQKSRTRVSGKLSEAAMK